MSIAQAIIELHNELPQAVKLVAVSKYKPEADILEAYAAGQRAFGENRPQELLAKATALPSDIEWHFIGHLQTNKLKMVIPYASLIQSVDSIHLLDAMNSYAQSFGKKVDCLLEVHIAQEITKQGFSCEEVEQLAERFGNWPFIHFRGIMGMASHTDSEAQIRSEFRTLKELSDRIRNQHSQFSELSMGMSGDWRIAVEEGASIVRIGSNIFGSR